MSVSKLFHTKVIKVSELQKAMDLAMKFYFPYEPLTQALRIPIDDELRNYFEPFAKADLEAGYTKAVIHNQSKQWVGTVFTSIYTKKEYELYRNTKIPSNTKGGVHKLFQIISQLEGLYGEVVEKDDEKLYYVKAGTIDPHFSGMGLMEILSWENVDTARKNGCSTIIVTLSNEKSKKIAKNMGFEIPISVKLTDFKIEGKSLIDPKNVTGEPTFAFGVKRL